MHPLVKDFKQAFAQNPEVEADIFNPPASEAEIAAFQAQIKNWSLPDLSEVFYDFYRTYNGSRKEDYSYVPFHEGKIIFSLDGILSDKHMWDDLEDKDTFKIYEPGTWWNKAWIPFLYIQDWWIGVIDTAGCFGGVPGQILSFDFKAAEGKHIMHASFEKWLETMLELRKNKLLHCQEYDNEAWYSPSSEEGQRKIQKAVNDDFPFFVEIWPYRRKDKAKNPHWQNLVFALQKDDLPTVQSLIAEEKIGLNEQNLYIPEKFTPLLLVIHCKAFKTAEWLLEQDADLHQKDCYGYDAFGKIVYGDYYQATYHELGKHTPAYIRLLRLILGKGYTRPVYQIEEEHLLTQLMHSATRLGDVEMAEFCLQEGVSINSMMSKYNPRTFLHDLAEDAKHLTMAEFLVEKGIDKTLSNAEGKTALTVFREKHEAFAAIMPLYARWIVVLSKTNEEHENI